MVINKRINNDYTILEIWSNGSRYELAVQHSDFKKPINEIAIQLIDEMRCKRPKIARSMSTEVIKLCSVLMDIKREVGLRTRYRSNYDK